MNDDLKKMTPEQLAEAELRAKERSKEIHEKMSNLMKAWKVEHTILGEEFRAYSEKYQAEFQEATAEEKRIWNFVHGEK